MKIKNLLIISILFFTFSACQKEEDNLMAKDPNVGDAKVGDGGITLQYLWGWLDCDPLLGGCTYYPFGCTWPSHNCLPEVVIRGAAERNDLVDLINHVNNDTYHQYFSSSAYKRTFGDVDSFPNMLSLLKNKSLDFDVQRSDTLDQDLYLIGFDKNVLPTDRKESDILLVFEIKD